MVEKEYKPKKAKKAFFNYNVISAVIVFGTTLFVFLLSFVVLGYDLSRIRTTSFWASFFLVLFCSELIYLSNSFVNKEKLKETKQNYIDSNNNYNELISQFSTNYKRQVLDDYAKEVNEKEKLTAYRMYLEQNSLCLDDIKLTKKQLKDKYNIKEQEEKLSRKQIKIWKKCKLGLMPYEKINTNVLLYDKDSFGKSNDKFGTDEISYKNEKQRNRMFTISKVIMSMVFVMISIDTIKNLNLEGFIKFFMYLIAIASAYVMALVNSENFIKDRVIEFGKRSSTLLDFFRVAKEKNYPKFNIYDYIENEKKEEAELDEEQLQ